jgi:hypothetical protein
VRSHTVSYYDQPGTAAILRGEWSGRGQLVSSLIKSSRSNSRERTYHEPHEAARRPSRSGIYSWRAVFILGDGTANAGQTINEAGAIAFVVDKWDEKEPEKGHKLVDMAARTVAIPDDPAAPKYTEDCVGKYEYMADERWKGSGTCTYTFKSGDKMYDSWEEGSDLKEYPYKITGGTGKYEGASGGGTYFYENLTDTLSGGTYKGQLVLP